MFKNKFFNALFMLVGTIIGAGIFGLPYVAAKTGFVATIIYLAILAIIVTLMHLLYGEVVLRTNGKHRLVGYAEIYLGAWGKRLASLSVIVGSYAGLLAYIIIGGKFLYVLLGGILGGDAFIYSVAMYLFSFIFVAKGLKMVSWAETFLSFLLIAAIFIFLGKGFFLMDLSNLAVSTDWSQIFFPYGIILFSLTGGSIIPDLVGILDSKRLALKKTIIWGTLIPAIIYLFFIAIVLGASGSFVTDDTITGLEKLYGNGFVLIGALVGFLAIITSLLAFGINLKKTFQYDYNLSKPLSLILAMAPSFLIFLAGFDNFLAVIGFSGAVMGGIDGLLIILMYQKADRGGKGDRKPEYDIITSKPVEYLLAAIFIAGIIYTVWGIR